jgi:galactose-1-phosphate uridylyltransferase
MRRDKDKLKFLAGIEQITGLMLSDILPEDAASRLKSLEID